MSNPFNNFLGQMINGAGNPKGQLGSFAHATRLYVDDTFALAPKNGWIYYVVFNINQSALGNNSNAGSTTGPTGGLLDLLKGVANTLDDWKVRRQPEIGMLVKSTDLPKFAIQNEVLNQYNRKTYIQKAITYNPINMSFHDDMSNVTHRLWTYYYKYYFADSNYGSGNNFQVGSLPAAYKDTKYKSNSNIFGSTNYGLNNGAVEPFFDSICIYQLNRKRFTSFILVNPMILQWDHDRLDQSSGNKILENKATIGYESVMYGEGYVKKDNPSGFATFHYDLTPSPLSIAGGGNNSLFGPGGIIDGASEVFGDFSNIANGNASPLSILGTALKTGNLLKNTKNVSGAGVSGELFGLLGNGRNLGGLAAAGAGLAGAGIKLFKGSNAKIDGKTTGVAAKVATAAGTRSIAAASTSASGNGTDSFLANAGDPVDLTDAELPDPLPDNVADLETLQQMQQDLLSETTDSVLRNQSLKDQYADQISQAQQDGDEDLLNSLYDELKAEGYTDPDLLSNKIEKINSNLEVLSSAIQEANDAATNEANLGKDGEPDSEEENLDEGKKILNPDDELSINNPDEYEDYGEVAWSDNEDWPTDGWA